MAASSKKILVLAISAANLAMSSSRPYFIGLRTSFKKESVLATSVAALSISL
jgi:hypothetical protein